MFGGRKRHNTKEAEQNQAQKKKWQVEIEDEMDEGIPEDLEIPKDLSDEENNQEKDQDEQIANENNKEEENAEENKPKEFDWMTSEDEMENGKEPEDDERLTKEKPENAENEENPEDQIVENDDSKDVRTIFISNIPLDATDEQILDKFRIFGTIMNLEVPRNEGSRLNKGRAFIEFSSVEEAQEVFEGKHYLKENLLNITLGLNKAINTVTAAPKELPFTYDERTKKYVKAGEIEMRKKLEEEEGSEESSDGSSSESGSESGSGSGSDSGESDSDDEQLIKRKKPVDEPDDEGDFKKRKGRRRKDSRSRSRSHSKSPTRTISTKKR